MAADERKQLILQKLDEDGFVSVSDLSKQMNVSEVTARTYLNQLEKEGMLNRTHGGAVKTKGMSYEPSAEEVEHSNMGLKRDISIKALEFIDDGDTIMLDTSSTCRQLALRIKESNLKDLVIITNSFRTHWELMGTEGIQLIHLGGITDHRMESAKGMMTINAMNQLRAGKAFIGANGIDLAAGITTCSFSEKDIKLGMMQRSSERYILLDSTKFDKTFVAVVGGVNDFDFLITDRNVPQKYIKAYENLSCQLVVADYGNHLNPGED